MQPRHTARGIVVHNGQLLLMERWRPGLHYFSIPGGGIEAGETSEETVEREILEETGLIVTTGRLVFVMRDGPVQHSIFLCEYVSGQPHLPADSPEAIDMTADNRFKPSWQSMDELTQLPFLYWQPVKQLLIDGLANGFSETVQIVSAATNR